MHMHHIVHGLVLLHQMERDNKHKSRTHQFFGLQLGGSNKTSSPSTAAATNNPLADDGQELDDLISALRSADIFTEDINKRRKHKKGKSTKTS